MEKEITAGFDETARNERIKQLAKQQHEVDGECEVDSNALISEGDDNGAYVQAWVWVGFEGTELDKGLCDECGLLPEDCTCEREDEE